MPSMGVVGSRLKKLVGSFDVLNFDLSLQRPAVVPSFDLKGVAGVLRSASNVVVMTGAGISTATGLPDFRSRGSGLYASESASGLGVERPEDAFSIAHFEANPEAYAPQYGGYCAYAASKGAVAPTAPDAWTVHYGKLYLNFSQTVRGIWSEDIHGNIAKADANWPAPLSK